jgi:hypothetical protein
MTVTNIHTYHFISKFLLDHIYIYIYIYINIYGIITRLPHCSLKPLNMSYIYTYKINHRAEDHTHIIVES